MKKRSEKPQQMTTSPEEKIYKNIGEKLKKLRKDAGFTSYEQFAWEYGLGRVQYGRLEKGTNMTIKSLLKILSVHKITFKEFFSDIE